MSLHRYFDFVGDPRGRFRGVAAGRLGVPVWRGLGEVLDGIRGLVMNHIIASIRVDAPGPVLRIPLTAGDGLGGDGGPRTGWNTATCPARSSNASSASTTTWSPTGRRRPGSTRTWGRYSPASPTETRPNLPVVSRLQAMPLTAFASPARCAPPHCSPAATLLICVIGSIRPTRPGGSSHHLARLHPT